ncbi:MAG: hypothetical protein Ta2E_00340 [Mycoplasmoidaceae bacterium]|nr:MAG: hypothetical protein Ta2E_00340 [Mycoplasmoidaceae bacterium]
MIDGWFYLIQRSDPRKHHENIYKIGRTNDRNRSIIEYPIDTQIISVVPVDNFKLCERELIKEIKPEIDWRNDIGNEYFEGNERDMISVFHDYYSEHLPHSEEEADSDYHWQIKSQRLLAERNQRRFLKWDVV